MRNDVPAVHWAQDEPCTVFDSGSRAVLPRMNNIESKDNKLCQKDGVLNKCVRFALPCKPYSLNGLWFPGIVKVL
jgi:hypothetical protein